MTAFELKDVEEVKPNLFVKKTRKGYRQVYPPHKDITKPLSLDNINWKRAIIGNPENTITIMIILAIVLFSAWAYNHDMEQCREIIEDEDFMFVWGNYKSGGNFGKVGEVNLSNLTWARI